MIVGARVVYDTDIDNMDSVTELEPYPDIFGAVSYTHLTLPTNSRV